jgi:murein DD-endopeptidase MepM/ murein hydrolase activator NlpD
MAYPVTSPKQKTSGWRTKARPTHTGTDFGWYVGGVTYPRDVFAISDGTVKTGSESRAGNYVNLYSGNKRWLYGHLASISVRNGQTVKAGQKLGVMGQTGNAQGVHLHLSLYINGVESNPELHITNTPVKKGG